jgi:hypothetical protein
MLGDLEAAVLDALIGAEVEQAVPEVAQQTGLTEADALAVIEGLAERGRARLMVAPTGEERWSLC